MMLYPSLDRLLEKIDSKYTLVTLSAKRARELLNDDVPMLEKTKSDKYIGQALEEINEGLITLGNR
ncbi:DNA-directed RNA polymerase subunit omega [Scopulibacillus cellulosilyticus]|uniref:DNA-directed RNA polymerase subunit omega n=1 Tax=Scopulibacillus cellulosilyticus TaxID=2665665 RepID=A0ABW2PTK4_9BACL